MFVILQIISLPIIVRTGANQASEHIGAQLWHSFSCPNVVSVVLTSSCPNMVSVFLSVVLMW